MGADDVVDLVVELEAVDGMVSCTVHFFVRHE
jgi:hypothetical protein